MRGMRTWWLVACVAIVVGACGGDGSGGDGGGTDTGGADDTGGSDVVADAADDTGTTPDTGEDTSAPDDTGADATDDTAEPEDVVEDTTTPDDVVEDTSVDAPDDTGDDVADDTADDVADTAEDVADTGDDADTTPDPTGSVTLYAEVVAGGGDTLLVSNGIPFAPGVLDDIADLRLTDGDTEIAVHVAVLARWPDDSIRAVLLQFERAASAFPADLILAWGASRTTTDRAAVPVDWTLPAAVAFPDADYLTGSRVLGWQVAAGADDRFAAYDANQADGYADLVGDGDWGPDARNDGYYSTTLNWYLHFVRTGDVDVYEWARREAIHYREDQIIHEGADAGTMNGRSEPRYLFLRAMEADYLLTGDPRTLEIAELMADYLLEVIDVDWFFYASDSERFWTERRVAFTLLGLIVYGRMSGDTAYLDATHARFDNLIATQGEHTDGGFIHHLYAHDSDECGTFGEYGGSPFMTGLLFEALITYYEQFGDERAVTSVVSAVDWLYDEGWYGSGFSYLIGCGYGAADEAPDLNLLTVAGFGFAYWATGEERFRTRGFEVFDAGVAEAYLGARKQFNQNYRSSGWFPGYVSRVPR